MSDDSLKNDAASQWPEEVRQAYASLKIPSLYDSVLINEKLSLEIRKQNREIKLMAENMGKMVSQLDSLLEAIAEEWQEYEEDDGENGQMGFEEQGELAEMESGFLSDKRVYLQRKTQAALIDMADSLFELSHSTKRVSHQLMSLLPKKEGLFSHLPHWRPVVEELIESFSDHVNRVRYRLLAHFEEMDIHLIEPRPGESLDSDKHQVLEQITGGQAGTIAQTVRIGYVQGNKTLRVAEVIAFI